MKYFSQASRSLASTLFILLMSSPLQALADACSDSQKPPCGPAGPGVLIPCGIPAGVPNPLGCYITTLLDRNMPYVFLIAIVLVVLSGIQYMAALGSSGNQAKAKQRIIGVLGGLAFYAVLRYVLPLVMTGITL